MLTCMLRGPGAERPVLVASAALLLQSLCTSELALRSYLGGRPEPLRPALCPPLSFFAGHPDNL